jgi:integrase
MAVVATSMSPVPERLPGMRCCIFPLSAVVSVQLNVVCIPTLNRTRTLAKPLHSVSVYQDIVKHYARVGGLLEAVPVLCVHSLRATAATNALSHKADIAKVQEWLGHSDISTMQMYDKRQSRPKDRPTFKVRY